MIKNFSFIILLTWSVIGFSQVNNISPYSYFGIGDNNQQSTVTSSSMGGINVARSHTNELNFTNPAALSALSLTTFSISGKTKYLQVNDGTAIHDASHTGFTSIGFGIPLGKKGGILFALQPNSSVGYSVLEEIKDGEDVIENTLFNGNGSTNRFVGGFGYQLIKGLSLGIEGEFLFGDIENNIINNRKDVAYPVRYRTISYLRGGSAKIGAQYHTKIKEKLRLDLGLSYKLKNTINASSEEYMYSFAITDGGELPKDTIVNNVDIEGKISRPNTITIGAGIGESNKWNVGVEYQSQGAISIDQSIFQNNKIQYTAKNRYSIGGYYIPKIRSITRYWHRVVYRAGLRYENTGLSVNTAADSGSFTQINDFGISFGLGLPIGNQLSQVNLGLEYGSRGDTTNGLIRENYYNLRLSLNIADKWFRKRKIN